MRYASLTLFVVFVLSLALWSRAATTQPSPPEMVIKLVRADKPSSKMAKSDAQKQIQTALLHLGFKNQKVDEFLSNLPKEIDVEEGVRRGLSALSNAL